MSILIPVLYVMGWLGFISMLVFIWLYEQAARVSGFVGGAAFIAVGFLETPMRWPVVVIGVIVLILTYVLTKWD